jgi:hypothetical protein
MSLRVYNMPKQAVQQQKRTVVAAAATLFVGVPLFTIAAGKLLHLNGTLTGRDVWSISIMLGIPCAILWLSTTVMKSVQIQLGEDRITRIQNHPFGHSQLKVTFARHEIGHIREVSKSGLYLRGRNSDGRWIDLDVPRSIENYDEIRTHLATWYPIRETWK